MSIFSDIFGGIVSKAKGIISQFKLDPAQEKQFELELEKIVQERLTEAENTYRKEVDAKMQIMVAELKQDDLYTKRARPTVIYGGLAFIFMVHVLLPVISSFTDHAQPDLSLPSEFWWAWGSVVSVYGIGRSIEKAGFQNKATNLITGKK